MDTVDPTTTPGDWVNVAASCTGTPALCVLSGTGASGDPQKVQVTLSASDLPSPRRVSFV